jgi:hypothetical protein
LSSSIRFGPSSAFKLTTPVRLPPGRFKLATNPLFTGSSPVVKTSHRHRGLLRACRERPRHRRPAEQRDEFTAFTARCLPCFRPKGSTPRYGRGLPRCGFSIPAMTAWGQNEKVSARAFLDRCTPEGRSFERGERPLRANTGSGGFYFRVVTSAAPYEMIAESSVRRKPCCSRSRAPARIRFT